MIRRGNHPYLGQWALPGGFVNMDESLEAAAARELKEETGLDNIDMEQLYTWGDVGRDPRTRVIGVSYMAVADCVSLAVRANDDADDARWFDVDYRLDQKVKTATAKGYDLERIYKLSLTNGADQVWAKVKVSRTVEGGAMKIQREIVESRGIAFDHAKIISFGIEKLPERR